MSDSGSKVRVRFAPSPTGALHIGGVRTALFNYIFAKQNGGDFILRIEDTDQTRFVKGAEDYILKSLDWLGIIPDESPKHNGDFQPYRQSERKGLYTQEIQKLIDNKQAYYAFDTPEELQELRKAAESKGEKFSYGISNRNQLNNSINLSDAEVSEKINSGEAYVIRLKVPENGAVLAEDIIRGQVKVESNQLDDKVLFKSDGLPTYHFANVVDDHAMQITHVIRGEEWLPSLPLHILLYQALNYPTPQFAHLPLILKPTGKGKLSKRDGDVGGFPVFPLTWETDETKSIGFKEIGFLKEGLLNFLLLLGWHPRDDKEFFTLDEMIESFDLERVTKSGARFDFTKALDINKQHIQKLSTEDFAEAFLKFKQENAYEIKDKDKSIAELFQLRVHDLKEIISLSSFVYEAPETYPEKPLKKFVKPESADILGKLKAYFSDLNSESASDFQTAIDKFMKDTELGFGKFMPLLRLALVGAQSGPDVPKVMEVLGKEESLNRIDKFLKFIEEN